MTRRSPRRRTYKGVDARLYGMQPDSRPGTPVDRNLVISLLYSQFTDTLAQLTTNLGGVIESQSGSGHLTNPLDTLPTSSAATDPATQLQEILSIDTQTFVALAFQLGSSGLPEGRVAPALTSISTLLGIYIQALQLPQ